MKHKNKRYVNVGFYPQTAHFSSVVEYILADFLHSPSSAERARSVLCGLDVRHVLHSHYGVLRGTVRSSFYDALENLRHKKIIDFW
ncbi:MAG: hypothetical protein ACRCY4_01085 [Brevinema sp.]